MIDHKAIIAAIRSQAKTATGWLPDAQVNWENVDFSPPQGKTWIKESYVPGEEPLVGNKTVEMRGFMEYAINVPKGTSTEAGETLAKEIRKVFVPSTSVGGLLSVVRAERLPGRPVTDQPWYRIPVRIYFWSQNVITT